MSTDAARWSVLRPGPLYLRRDGGWSRSPTHALRMTEDDAFKAKAVVRALHPDESVIVVVPPES